MLKPTYSLLLLLSLYCCFVASCETNDDDNAQEMIVPPPSREEFISCHEAETWSTEDLYAALVGTWQTEYLRCFWSGPQHDPLQLNQISVRIMADSTVEIFENQESLGIFPFLLDEENPYGKNLRVSPYNWRFNGIPYFCGDQLMMADALDDACERYLYRVE